MIVFKDAEILPECKHMLKALGLKTTFSLTDSASLILTLQTCETL